MYWNPNVANDVMYCHNYCDKNMSCMFMYVCDMKTYECTVKYIWKPIVSPLFVNNNQICVKFISPTFYRIVYKWTLVFAFTIPTWIITVWAFPLVLWVQRLCNQLYYKLLREALNNTWKRFRWKWRINELK